MNYTWPRFLHIISNEHMLYVTIIIWKWRLHWQFSRKELPEKGLW